MSDEELYPWTKIAPPLGVIFVSPALLTVSTTMGTILSLEWAIIVSFVAGLVFSLIIYLHGGVGANEHMGFLKLMEASLGKKGSRFLASPLITLTQIGWFSVLITLGGNAMSKLTGLFSPFSITTFGVLVAAVTYFGFRSLSDFTKVTASITGIFAVWALYAIIFQEHGAPSRILGGDIIYASTLAIGGAMSISTVSPDFVKSARSKRDLEITAFGVVLPVVIFTLVSGNIIGQYTMVPNPVNAIILIGLPILANLLLLLGSTAAASSLYPPSIALSALAGVSRRHATIFATLAGLLLAHMGILDLLRAFLQLIGLLLPPLIGINIIEYYFISKSIQPKEGIYLKGIASWVLGFGLGSLIPYGITPINSLVISMVFYFVMHNRKIYASSA